MAAPFNFSSSSETISNDTSMLINGLNSPAVDDTITVHDVSLVLIGVLSLACLVAISTVIWLITRKNLCAKRRRYVTVDRKDHEMGEGTWNKFSIPDIPINYQIDPRRLEIEERIGDGRYGEVYQGVLKSTKDKSIEVAVKALDSSSKVTPIQISILIQLS